MSCNVASHLPRLASELPFGRAVICPAGREKGGAPRFVQLTFAQLNARVDRAAHALTLAGVRRGMRTVLLVKPSPEFFSLVFALFKIGAPMVLIDPGLPRDSLIECLKEAGAEAFIGLPEAHVARLLFRQAFTGLKVVVTVGPRLFWGGHSLAELLAQAPEAPFPTAEVAPEELAAILYTSGSTGIPKGALYTHGIFDAQVRLIRDNWHIEAGEVDLCTFPLFALFDPALGMTAVVPQMDFRQPAKADPKVLIETIETFGCTSMFGSPALLDTLSRYGAAHGVKLPSVRRVLSSGAPMTAEILRRISGMLVGEAQVFTPFGATESLPVANIGHKEILEHTLQRTLAGDGICVGRPVSEMTVRIIAITEEAIPTWSDALELPRGEIGEITVRGPVVTPGYWAREEQTALAKIREGSQVVHRMGDVGWMDAQGRLWMCGRKSHRVEGGGRRWFSVPVEEVFNAHPAVKRSALVWRGSRPAQRPALLVELEGGAKVPPEGLVAELRELGRAHAHTADVEEIRIYPGAFPVDIRHNAKIGREKLAAWLQQLGEGS